MNILLIGGQNDGTFIDVKEGIDHLHMRCFDERNRGEVYGKIKTETYIQTPIWLEGRRLPIFVIEGMTTLGMMKHLVNNYKVIKFPVD